MMCPDYRTPYILKCKHEQEIEQVFVLYLTQTYVWTMIIIVREIMEIKKTVRMTWLQPHMSFRL